MPSRLRGGFLWLFDRRNEKIAAVVCLATIITLAAAFGKGKDVLVDGRIERVALLGDQVIPKWMFFVVGVPSAFLFHWLLVKLLDLLWKERPEYQAVKVEKIFERQGGGYVAWKPEVPGTPSPMEYTPPALTRDTTAMEFIMTEPPHPMRALLNIDTQQEYIQHTRAIDDWLYNAPEMTLRDLLPSAQALGDIPDYVEENLARASKLRGIPSKEELHALFGEQDQLDED